MAISQRIVPNIWSTRNAEEMGEFYAASLPDTTSEVESRYPDEGLLDFQREFAGQPLTVTVVVAGTKLTLVNGGDEFRPTPAISFMLNFDPLLFGGGASDADAATREALDATWAALADGGEVRMELGEYPFARRYGWVEDRYGVNWQLMLTDPAGEPRPFVVPALMFGGPAQDKAAEASDFYVALFSSVPGGAAVGSRFPYMAPTGPASAEALAFGEFRVGDQWFMASDFGADHAFAFTEGVSLEVQCEDQAEIDRLWSALSAVPEAEQCGWLKDRYGVSWQIVPENMAELMSRPHAFARMLEMKKLVIADF
ncbi:MAG TPA: VOC family protein [Arachnia sp.]|mgnify:CR=1 FL=1|nr:VOC family protein [Arachnia sp.]HMT87023.1 VOC family protein [Arachnia sp.]